MSADGYVLVGGPVITMDTDRRLLDPGAVVVEGDRIQAVDEREDVLAGYPDRERIDLGGTVLLPGLVDSHGHAGHGLTKTLAEGESGGWLKTVEEIYFRNTGERFWRAEGYLSALEHLECGVTTSLSFTGSKPRVDDPKYALAAAEGYEELGLRHIVNLGPPTPPYPQQFADPDTGTQTTVTLADALETTDAVIEAIDGQYSDRLAAYVGPSSLVPELAVDDEAVTPGPTTDQDMPLEDATPTEFAVRHLEGIAEVATDHDVPIHTHAYAGMVTAAAAAPVDILGRELSLAHCAGMSEAELDLMADHDVSASHGPLTHAYALNRFPLVEALDAGVNVAISTDGSAPDRSFDLLGQGRIAGQLQRVHFNDTTVLPAGKLLEMMTIDAARALELDDEVGSLEPGKKADVIALDLEQARLQPRLNLVQQVVHYASGLDTTFMMVDGTVLFEDRSFGGVDVEGILAEADAVAREALDRADATSTLEPHPDTWGRSRYGEPE